MKKQIRKGISDIPITKRTEDSFGLGAYVDGLANYISVCETPMTIAVQGDWGSGKTSLLNMVKGTLEKDIKALWFNTWQYSKFHMDENLTLTFLSRLSTMLNDDAINNKTREKLAVLARAGVKVGSYIVDFLGAGKVADDIGEIGSNHDRVHNDAVKVIEELKKDFQSAIDKTISKDYRRVVIFIDDLDRLSPERAVDLLEVLKLFLDCQNCVFVLAIDHGVVMRGIEKKYGEDFSREQGKKFFDKIIQVPLFIPVEQYQITEYIKKLMASIVKLDEQDVEDYEFFVLHSIGSNPRSMKRLFNTFLLLTTINERSKAENDALAQKMLFAVLCMQLAMEEVYRKFVENTNRLSSEFFENELDEDEKTMVFLKRLVQIVCPNGEEDFGKGWDHLKNALSISSSTSNERIETAGDGMELQEDKTYERTIGPTEVKYRIITMGAEMHIGFGKEIEFKCGNSSYRVKMHNGIKGRIGRIGMFYADSNVKEGDKLRLEYHYERNEIICTIIS